MSKAIISNKIDENLWKEFKKTAIDRNKKIAEAIEDAMKEWVRKK